MTRRTWLARLLLAGLTAAVVAAPATAGLLPVSVTVQPESGNFRWTYSVVLPTDMQLQAGNYFTIYDFSGYVPGSGGVLSPFPGPWASAYWTFSVSNVGPTPPLLSPVDDPGIVNLTWTYTGPTIPAGSVTLGNFIATSIYSQATEGFFTATNPRAADGVIDNNITNTLVPTGQGGGEQPVVPEPATLALAGLGLPLIALRRWWTRA